MTEKCSETKIRYLEMIQNVITRMANNSFKLKGWAITLVAGIFALSSKDADKSFFFIAYIPVALFWFTDSYYLQQERLYRKLYNKAIKLQDEDIDMGLTPPAPNSDSKTLYLQSVRSKTEAGFYIPLALAVAIIIYFSC